MTPCPHRAFTSGLAVLALAGCAKVGSMVPVGTQALQIASSRPSFTDADEERMAQAQAAAFEDSVPMWDDPLLEAYITDLAQRIVAVARPRPFAYRVRVVKDANVNAFTFGGGLLYVHAGLIARMENEAQLAMVLGHEIAHVTERHVPGGIEHSFGLQVLGQIAATTASATGTLQGEALDKVYDYSMNAAVNGHGRGQESEADEVGLRYMVGAGFDPREAPLTFQQLYKEYGDAAPLQNFFYGSHPTNVSRYERLTALVRERFADPAAGATRTVNSEEFKRRTREVVVAVGTLDYANRRYRTAQAMFAKAAPAAEDDPVPHYYLGRIAMETGDAAQVDTALAHFRQAVAADSTFAPVWRETGVAWYRKKNRVNGIASFERYLTLAPDAEDATRVRAMIAELRRY